jgi:hypothetical protein
MSVKPATYPRIELPCNENMKDNISKSLHQLMQRAGSALPFIIALKPIQYIEQLSVASDAVELPSGISTF